MRHLDRIAGALALLLVLAIFGWWWHERVAPHEGPRFASARFAEVTPPLSPLGPGEERWLVTVNPGCPHCSERLAHLARVLSARSGGGPVPRLAVLVVDWPQRPQRGAYAALAPGGVWWDSARVWRRSWRHGEYGEVLVFAHDGALLRTHSPTFEPDTIAAR